MGVKEKEKVILTLGLTVDLALTGTVSEGGLSS